MLTTKKLILIIALGLMPLAYAVDDDLDGDLAGFGDDEETETINYTADKPQDSPQKSGIWAGLSGKITEQLAYSYHGDEPHDNLTILKSSIFLDYDYKFANGLRLKINSKAYYDAIYDVKDADDYVAEERQQFQQEIELFDAYIEYSMRDNLDIKLGRQVIVWGRSDTIRITDILNPLDNRRPGMIEIEDLRLPVATARINFFFSENWHITKITILEQRFSKNPPFASAFYKFPKKPPENESYTDITHALSLSGEFSGWDINFYAAKTRNDAGYIKQSAPTKTLRHHDLTNMLGTALNILYGSWLFKAEFAHLSDLTYTKTQDKYLNRNDGLLGLEYKGIADTIISYDYSIRHFTDFDNRLEQEAIPVAESTHQQAFRISSDFINATLHANYLLSLYGSNADEGGFQKIWLKYDLADGFDTNIGIIDYKSGSKLFDAIADNDMLFADVSYYF